MHQVALDLTLLRDIEHVAADVDADPLVSVLFERLATKPGAAPDVEDHARPALRQAEHLDGALSHLRLHVDHTRRVQVLARLCRVIEHLGRRYLLWPRHCGRRALLAPARSKMLVQARWLLLALAARPAAKKLLGIEPANTTRSIWATLVLGQWDWAAGVSPRIHEPRRSSATRCRRQR